MINKAMVKFSELQDTDTKSTHYKDKLAHIALDEMGHFVGLLDTDGKLLEVNRAAIDIARVKPSDVIGKLFWTTIWWSVSEKNQQNLRKAVAKAATGELVRYDVEIYGRGYGKETILVDFLLKPIKDESGKVIFILTEGHDVTAKKVYEREIAHMLMQAPIGICVLDGPDHIFTLTNSTYLSLMFDQKRDLLGMPIAEALPELKGKEIERRLDEVYKNGQPYLGTEMPVQIVQKNNLIKKMYVDFIYHPVRSMDGQVRGVLVVVTDVTEKVNARKKVEESEMRYRSLTDTIPQMMWTTTPDGQVSYANKRCLQYTGAQSVEKFNDSWSEILHPDDAESTNEAWNYSIATGKPFIREYRLRRADGEYRWFLDRTIAVRNKENIIQYRIGTATDIDDQKKTVAELAIAKELAEHANATKSAFLANMSHEIRTPLGAILGFSGLLKDTGLSDDDRELFINKINRNGQALTRIIDDILDLAKVEAGRLDVEEIDFSLFDLMSEVVDLFKEKAKQKNIYLLLNIEDSVPNHILTDPTRLRQILINIIGNAIKFTAVGGVRVQVKVVQHTEGALRLAVYVKDTGPGLTDEQKKRLFKPFSQGDNTMTRQFGGTGLGLVLSQRLSQALGGQIDIEECEIGKGCTFAITFVATISNRPQLKNLIIKQAMPLQTKTLPLIDVRVLLVDDSVDNQFLVKRLLMKSGAFVELASDGVQAVEKALANSYDIILMDIQMPNMDGYQAIKILNQKKYNKPIIALTAHAMLEDLIKTKTAGFVGHLTKPIDVNELVQSIKTLTH